MDKIEEVNKMLEACLDEYMKEARINFFDLPYPVRERVVRFRDKVAQAILKIIEEVE